VKRIIRHYIFTGDDEWIEAMLRKSLPDGEFIAGKDRSIFVSTFSLMENIHTDFGKQADELLKTLDERIRKIKEVYEE